MVHEKNGTEKDNNMKQLVLCGKYNREYAAS
jgi:hypothetical protein